MVSVAEATKLILENAWDYGVETVHLGDSMGRVLREDLIADRDFPPFDRVTMDGIAISHAAWRKGFRSFPIDAIAAAGAPQRRLKSHETCIEVMTGAVLPDGCDTVIRYEDLKINNGVAEIIIDEIETGKNVHRQGTDRKAGDIIVKAGKNIGAPELGVAATIGKFELQVEKLPRIAVISTGDELVDISDEPLPHQIRKSNTIQIAALLRQQNVQVETFHLEDDQQVVEGVLGELIRDFDCIVLSGGVSAGKYDYVPTALDALGVQKVFHKVAQRPGKPFWFGVGGVAPGITATAVRNPGAPIHPRASQCVVFALPGNPVSSFMCTIRYILPWLDACQGMIAKPSYAVLTKDVHFKPALTCFMQVKISYGEDGVCYATPVEGHGSGDLANLVEGDGFLEMEDTKDDFLTGEQFKVWEYRQSH